MADEIFMGKPDPKLTEQFEKNRAAFAVLVASSRSTGAYPGNTYAVNPALIPGYNEEK